MCQENRPRDTRVAESAAALFEAPGFEKRRSKVSGVSEDIVTVRMKEANGFHVDITRADIPEKDMTFIRMSVDDPDGACHLLTAHGFKAAQDCRSLTQSSKSVLMASTPALPSPSSGTSRIMTDPAHRKETIP